MLRFSRTVFIPLLAFPVLLLTHGYQGQNPNGSWVEQNFGTSWLHFLFEVSLTLYIVFLGVHGMNRPTRNPLQESLSLLTPKEKETLVKEWKPEPLVPVEFTARQQNAEKHRPKIVCDGRIGKYVSVGGKEYLNLASYNMLNFVGNPELEETAKTAVRKYGVGSCGPRGFYGTVDVHLELEEKIAKFMGCEEAILYSYGTATISSAIPAYAKRGDLIFVDDGVNYAIQQGLTVSRSSLRYFRHNDVDHLESLLENLQKEYEAALAKPRRKFFDRDDVDHPSRRRVFLVAEGLYANYGDLCPLPKLVALKKKYKFRIFLDETYSIGVVGKTGRGVTEHFGINRDDIDLIAGSLEHSFGSTGGFCCGSSFVIDHQRLSGLGYCFSASLPPLLAAAAINALELAQQKPEIFDQLKTTSMSMHERLTPIKGLKVEGWEGSPIKHMRLANSTGSYIEDSTILDGISSQMNADSDILALTAKYIPSENNTPLPSIRVVLNVGLTEKEMDWVADSLRSAVRTIVA